jgi:hypothetical protein
MKNIIVIQVFSVIALCRNFRLVPLYLKRKKIYRRPYSLKFSGIRNYSRIHYFFLIELFILL